MMCILKTERLTLHHFSTNDAPFVYELLNDPDWIRFIGDRGIRTIDDAHDFIENKLMPAYQTFGFGFYLVKIKKSDEPIGLCGLVKRDFLDDVDIGFAFLPTARGKGFALEAAEAVMNYGTNTLEIGRIVAITDAKNARSIRLLEKLGLHLQETIIHPDNTPVNLFVPST